MTCARCGKRLSRKTARQIDGVVMCAPCMFGQAPKSVTDCGDDGCGECDVCRYLGFLEWAGSVGKPEGSTIERNEAIEAHLRRTYPDTFAPAAIADTRPQGGDRRAPFTSGGGDAEGGNRPNPLKAPLLGKVDQST